MKLATAVLVQETHDDMSMERQPGKRAAVDMKDPTKPSDLTTTSAQGTPVAGQGSSFRGILKSSALIGGSSLINIGLGALRSKALALMLGPSGIGLLGAFTMILDLARNFAELGITSSGVRQIAEAASSGEERRLALTGLLLRRTTLCCAFLGSIVLWACSGAVSRLTFGTDEHAMSISILSFALFLSVVAGGQAALLQGTRRINDLAKVSVYGALLGTIFAVSIVYVEGERGIVPSLVASAIASALLYWWFSRRVRIVKVILREGEVTRETAQLFKLGLAFLASGLLMTGATFAVRTFVIRELGLEAAGMYQAAWALGGLYVGLVLQALGMDFYPRLVGVAHDHHSCNATVNEQTTASLFLAAPGIVATITFAPMVILIFYSAKFGGAVLLLQWFCLGMALRVITWPIGYIIVAKNCQFTFFATEVAWATFNIGVTWWALRAFGLEGAGIAFMLSYLFHALVVYSVVRNMTGFRFTNENQKNCIYFVLTCSIAFVAQRGLPDGYALAFGSILTIVSAWYSFQGLARLSSVGSISQLVRRTLRLKRPQ